jgi:hypothetical protein
MLARNTGDWIFRSRFRDEVTLKQFSSRRDTRFKEDRILIRRAMVAPVEQYRPERKAEFLLSNAIDDADYRKARKEVWKLGLDPDSIPHLRPK